MLFIIQYLKARKKNVRFHYYINSKVELNIINMTAIHASVLVFVCVNFAERIMSLRSTYQNQILKNHESIDITAKLGMFRQTETDSK